MPIGALVFAILSFFHEWGEERRRKQYEALYPRPVRRVSVVSVQTLEPSDGSRPDSSPGGRRSISGPASRR